MILDHDIAALVGVYIAVDIVCQCPDVRFLRDIYIVTDHQLSAAAIQQNPPIDHNSIADKNITSISQFDSHEKADSPSHFGHPKTKQRQSEVAAGDIRQEVITNVRYECRCD
jgi:hypothetical protein